ncbi:hypothetical protein OG705_30115 [Streptomyces sp. NBC_00838]|uniref:hypothetical protein n=1 Tax=Streptomyces sp. NBC_00838 TaxID=2903680 RepID=UPI00386EA56A|nr:hypothetical protein OG705_30115 [Streptomyces sp. NBC_00838]
MGLSMRAGRPAGPHPEDPNPQWSYSGFGIFRRALAEHIGIDLTQMQNFGGTTNWGTVTSPLRHLLEQADDSGELTARQARELAPALREAVTALAELDTDGFLWSDTSSNGRASEALVALLDRCAAEDLPVYFR